MATLGGGWGGGLTTEGDDIDHGDEGAAEVVADDDGRRVLEGQIGGHAEDAVLVDAIGTVQDGDRGESQHGEGDTP